MDPIETWHDTPEFERMEAKIKTLKAKLAALVEAAEWAKAWIEPTDHSNPQADVIYGKLKDAVSAAKVQP